MGAVQKGVGEAAGEERGDSYTVSSPTLGVYIFSAPSGSDALKDQWRRTVRSNATVFGKLVNKQKNAFIYRSQVKYTLLDLTIQVTAAVFKNTLLHIIKASQQNEFGCVSEIFPKGTGMHFL